MRYLLTFFPQYDIIVFVKGDVKMKIYNNISELIGKTPLVKLNNIKKEENLYGNILAKLEYFNPASSIKDRAAFEMLDAYEKAGLLNKDTVIIEPTSGNTGIGLCAICASKGYKTIIVMPESMSEERKKIMKFLGAELVLTKKDEGMPGAIKKAYELKEEIKGSLIAGQFENPANPEAHYKTTGPEIWEDTDGKIDILVCGIGTGGTISGTGKFLKEKNQNIKIVGVEPFSSPFLSQNKSGPHAIQGIGAGFIPKILDTKIYDEIITVKDEDALSYSKLIAKKEGIMVGISSGAALFGAISLAKKEENKDKNIVVVLPDTAERYISTSLFDFSD